jgi:uncharacterized membrane protein
MTMGRIRPVLRDRKVNIMLKLLVVAFIIMAPAALMAQTDSAMYAKCKVSVSWSRNGEDAVVTVTVKNGTKKTLIDPLVRVTFYDENDKELTTDAKMYFVRLGPGKSKTMEARFWNYVPLEAVNKKTKGMVEGGYFE